MTVLFPKCLLLFHAFKSLFFLLCLVNELVSTQLAFHVDVVPNCPRRSGIAIHNVDCSHEKILPYPVEVRFLLS